MTKHVAVMICAITVMVLSGGCEDDVAGPAGVDEPFSMYGIINPRLETQTLLVSPITDLLYPLDASIDAAVTSVDLTAGVEYLWKDSVVANETGQLDHVFWADFRPNFGSRHRIEIRRSDGAVTSVDAAVPETITVEQEDTATRFLFATIRGEDFRLVRIDVLYRVRAYYAYRGFEEINEEMPYSTYAFSKTGRDVEADGGWRLRINMDADYESMRSLYFDDHFQKAEGFIGFDNPICDGLALYEMRISLTVGSEDWDPPGGEFDPGVLVQPGTLTNVENGYGFVTGGYNDEAPLYPSTASLDDTWFFDFVGGRTPVVTGCGRYAGG